MERHVVTRPADECTDAPVAPRPDPAVTRLGRRDRVLVVDDDDVIRSLVRDGLEREGFEVHDVADGASASRSSRSNPPSLVILDVNLPARGGFEVLSAIRAELGRPGDPAHGPGLDEIDRVLGLELGADDYVDEAVLAPRARGPGARVLRRSATDPDPAARVRRARDRRGRTPGQAARRGRRADRS